MKIQEPSPDQMPAPAPEEAWPASNGHVAPAAAPDAMPLGELIEGQRQPVANRCAWPSSAPSTATNGVERLVRNRQMRLMDD